MTTKRDSKRTPKKAERPKLKKDTIRDLAAKDKGEGVKGGFRSGGCWFSDACK